MQLGQSSISLHLGLFCLVLGLIGCSGDSNNKTSTAQGPDPDRGRKLYLVNCTVCHNREPAKDGPTGPAIMGASLDLLEARILHRKYPPGYVPKRNSTAMPAYPHLRKVIPDIAAYLSNGPKDPSVTGGS